MSKEVWIGKKGFRYWYYKFRDSELYSFTTVGVAIVICLALLIYWIIPELNNWFSIRNEVIATRQRIAVLQQNINFINTLNKNTLNQQLQVATGALPSEKDFGTILDAISYASVNSGVSLSDYSFQVGNIASSSGQVNVVGYNGLSSIQVTIVVNGGIDQIKHFIQSLENTLPLSEVTMIDGSGGNISLTIQFYQKPFPASNFSTETPLTPLSAGEVSLLQTLSQWKTTTGIQNAAPQTSSSSASSIPLF